jgi:SSS family solute:Na+ symporter
LLGGFVALTGKLINLWGDPLTGNLIIILAFGVNAGLLFLRIWKRTL